MRSANFFRRRLAIVLLLAGPLLSLEARDDTPAQFRAQALATMEDIVPHDPASSTFARVTGGNHHAIWGKIFGDEQIAALVAVTPAVHRPDTFPDEATLVLLLWRNGWKYRQLVGPVSAQISPEEASSDHIETWDWEIKRTLAPERSYVISRLHLEPGGDHLSWFCNPKSHTLVPTRWPKDALPSLSGAAIICLTLRREEKPGFGPTVYEVFRFTDHPGELVVSYDSNNANGHPSGHGFLVRDPKSKEMVSWWFWPKKKRQWSDPQEFGLSRQAPAAPGVLRWTPKIGPEAKL